MKLTKQKSKSAVLHSFAIEENLNAETLARYLKHYPQFREELVDLSIELFTAPPFDELSTKVVSEDSDSAKLAWTKFQSMLGPNDPAKASASPTAENPIKHLSKQDFRDLAKDLGVNRLFLSLLRDNAIIVSTIPEKFLLMLAKKLHVSADVLARLLDSPRTVATTQRFKASDKPSAGIKVGFDEALVNSELSEEQQTALRKMKD